MAIGYSVADNFGGSRDGVRECSLGLFAVIVIDAEEEGERSCPVWSGLSQRPLPDIESGLWLWGEDAGG